ncbi:MAG: aminotransferase class IV family protein [Pelagimonas sp.]|uniref:aminotransferase class IV family protein n=1 Tax=Pelagimonas sp. TaxID=2073170 RepID=UPI003D6A56A2
MESPLCPTEPEFRLIETFAFKDDQGIPRLSLHLARLSNAAEALGIEFDKNRAVELLDALSGGDKRCRLTLDKNGALDLDLAVMPAPSTQWTFRIHPTRLDASDPWLRYKSTRRELYNSARSSLPTGLDEFVFLNQQGAVCEGTITNISITTATGDRLTPPLASGCLPGTYRQSRLNKGLLREATLTLSDLAAATSINLTNSLRGSVNAVWDSHDPARP